MIVAYAPSRRIVATRCSTVSLAIVLGDDRAVSCIQSEGVDWIGRSRSGWHYPRRRRGGTRLVGMTSAGNIAATHRVGDSTDLREVQQSVSRRDPGNRRRSIPLSYPRLHLRSWGTPPPLVLHGRPRSLRLGRRPRCRWSRRITRLSRPSEILV